MPSVGTTVRRRLKAFHRNLRGVRMIAGAFASTDHPLLAHIIPTRRCNLACEYCNEYDDFSVVASRCFTPSSTRSSTAFANGA